MTATRTDRPTETLDATKVRAQPSLTSSSGAIWLIVGGLLAVTGVAILAPMTALALPALAVAGIVAIVALYAAMVIVKLAVPAGRMRLGLLAAGMILIAVVELGCIGAITAIEWNVLN